MYFAPVGFLAFTIGMRATWRKWTQRLRRRRSATDAAAGRNGSARASVIVSGQLPKEQF